MHAAKDILLAALCFAAVGGLLEGRSKYNRAVIAILVPALAVLGFVMMVDLVWPIRALVLIAAAGVCAALGFSITLSVHDGWPRLYIRTLQVGWAMGYLSLCTLAATRLNLVPKSPVIVLAAGGIGLAGMGLNALAYLRLRPKDRPRDGLL